MLSRTAIEHRVTIFWLKKEITCDYPVGHMHVPLLQPSMTTARRSRIDLSQLLQGQNPTIDLRINIFEDSTRNFLKALVGFKNKAITSISERRKYQIAEKKKFAEKTQHVEKEINKRKLIEIDLVAGMRFDNQILEFLYLILRSRPRTRETRAEGHRALSRRAWTTTDISPGQVRRNPRRDWPIPYNNGKPRPRCVIRLEYINTSQFVG